MLEGNKARQLLLNRLSTLEQQDYPLHDLENHFFESRPTDHPVVINPRSMISHQCYELVPDVVSVIDRQIPMLGKGA